MQVFKIRQDGFKEIRKQMLLRSIPILLIATTAGILIGIINAKSGTGVNVLPYVVPFLAIALGVGLYRGINRQRALFDSYTLIITNNLISREQLNTPTISIYFNDVKEISRNKNGSFTIRGKETRDLIGIPAQINDVAEVEAALEKIKSISVKGTTPFFEKYQSLAGLLAIGLMICVYTLSNKIIVALAGSVLITLIIWSIIKIRSSKNIDNKTRRSVWWMLLVLASVIAVMFLKLSGLMDLAKN